jgi:hypothetical protein
MKISYVAGVLLFATPCYAKPVARSFTQPCDAVFAAAEKLASEKPYHITMESKADHNLVVATGSWMGSGRRDMFTKFEAEGQGCKVTTDAPYSGVFRHGSVFLDRLEKAMKDKQ